MADTPTPEPAKADPKAAPAPKTDSRTLVVNVNVDGVVYGPAAGNADQVPAEVAAKIGDHAWQAPPSAAS